MRRTVTMTDDIKELTIDRSKWLVLKEHRGGGFGALYRNRRMCCLGFLCKANGVRVADMNTVSMPGQLPDSIKAKLQAKLPLYLLEGVDYNDSAWADRAAQINDNNDMTVWGKERALSRHFKKVGIRLKFVGRTG
jgi:hypothetical protein